MQNSIIHGNTATPVNLTAGRTLGLVSIGVAMAELMAPKLLQRVMGLDETLHTGTFRVLGIRELMHGLDLLLHRHPKTGVFSRVAGDVLDGAVLAVAARKTRRPWGFAAVAALVMPIVIADLLLAKKLSD